MTGFAHPPARSTFPLCRWRAIAGGACLLALAACRDDAPAEATAASAIVADCSYRGGPVRKDLLLRSSCGPYEIRGGIDVLENTTLFIEPGVEMRFHDGDWLEISAAGTRGGRLIARGTPERPIVLTSADPATVQKRSWFGLWFNAGTARGSVLSHAVVRLGGGKNRHIKPTLTQGCITLTEVPEGNVTLEHITLEGCVQAGLVLRASQPAMRDIHVKDMETGMLLSPELPDSVTSGIRFDKVERHMQRKAL